MLRMGLFDLIFQGTRDLIVNETNTMGTVLCMYVTEERDVILNMKVINIIKKA